MAKRYYSFGQAALVPASPADTPQQETFWQRHGGEIIVGTITSVTGAIAVYFAMRLVERRR